MGLGCTADGRRRHVDRSRHASQVWTACACKRPMLGAGEPGHGVTGMQGPRRMWAESDKGATMCRMGSKTLAHPPLTFTLLSRRCPPTSLPLLSTASVPATHPIPKLASRAGCDPPAAHRKEKGLSLNFSARVLSACGWRGVATALRLHCSAHGHARVWVHAPSPLLSTMCPTHPRGMHAQLITALPPHGPTGRPPRWRRCAQQRPSPGCRGGRRSHTAASP